MSHFPKKNNNNKKILMSWLFQKRLKNFQPSFKKVLSQDTSPPPRATCGKIFLEWQIYHSQHHLELGFSHFPFSFFFFSSPAQLSLGLFFRRQPAYQQRRYTDGFTVILRCHSKIITWWTIFEKSYKKKTF